MLLLNHNIKTIVVKLIRLIVCFCAIILFFTSKPIYSQNRSLNQLAKSDLQNDDRAFSFQKSLRVSYVWGPEVYILLLPPVKVGFELESLHSHKYFGFDASFMMGGVDAFWGQIGAYGGFREGSVLLENKLNYFFTSSSGGDKLQILSIIPKIGFQYKRFYIKAGPTIKLARWEIDYNFAKITAPIISGYEVNIEIGYQWYFNNDSNIRTYK